MLATRSPDISVVGANPPAFWIAALSPTSQEPPEPGPFRIAITNPDRRKRGRYRPGSRQAFATMTPALAGKRLPSGRWSVFHRSRLANCPIHGLGCFRPYSRTALELKSTDDCLLGTFALWRTSQPCLDRAGRCRRIMEVPRSPAIQRRGGQEDQDKAAPADLGARPQAGQARGQIGVRRVFGARRFERRASVALHERVPHIPTYTRCRRGSRSDRPRAPGVYKKRRLWSCRSCLSSLAAMCLGLLL